jgi:hypothetical protein
MGPEVNAWTFYNYSAKNFPLFVKHKGSSQPLHILSSSYLLLKFKFLVAKEYLCLLQTGSGSISPRIQWVMWAISPGVKLPQHSYPVPTTRRPECVEICLNSAIRLRGLVLRHRDSFTQLVMVIIIITSPLSFHSDSPLWNRIDNCLFSWLLKINASAVFQSRSICI